MLKYNFILCCFVCRQNEGSFGCEAVARAFGQPNVPECVVGFHFLCLYAAKISLSFCRLFCLFTMNANDRGYGHGRFAGVFPVVKRQKEMRAQNPQSAHQPACEHRRVLAVRAFSL